MHHHVARVAPVLRASSSSRRGLAFGGWEEGLELFARLLAAAPNPLALCVMPDHIHLVHREDRRTALAPALRGYARWWNARRGRRGALWGRQPRVDFVPRGVKRRRVLRYVHLNPCRARLVSDPLAWPLSTYRDALGLALDPACAPSVDPIRLHAYTTGDDSVSFAVQPPGGGHLPEGERAALRAIEGAVSEISRVPLLALRRRGVARSLAVRSARALTAIGVSRIASHFDISRQAVYAMGEAKEREVELVARVAGDERFAGLATDDPRLFRERGKRLDLTLRARRAARFDKPLST